MLEDQISETSSKDDNQITLLFIKLTVAQSMFLLSTDSSFLFKKRIYIFHLTVVKKMIIKYFLKTEIFPGVFIFK